MRTRQQRAVANSMFIAVTILQVNCSFQGLTRWLDTSLAKVKKVQHP